ncbi:MAG: hypothetical protein ABIG93_05040 [archaeon]|nr:hypothetical protein [Nanoarchaeota archaeon]
MSIEVVLGFREGICVSHVRRMQSDKGYITMDSYLLKDDGSCEVRDNTPRLREPKSLVQTPEILYEVQGILGERREQLEKELSESPLPIYVFENAV